MKTPPYPALAARLKAFSVLERSEGTGGVVFAKSAIAARRIGASIYASGEFESVEAKRMPWADQYSATGIVPAKDLVAQGWYFECHGCGVKIDYELFEETAIEPDDIEGSQDAPYCTSVCKAKYQLERALAERMQKRWIRRFKRLIKAKFPQASFEGKDYEMAPHAFASRANGIMRLEQIHVPFRLEGLEYAPPSLRIDRQRTTTRDEKRPCRPYWSCSAADHEAFKEMLRQAPNLKKDTSHAV